MIIGLFRHIRIILLCLGAVATLGCSQTNPIFDSLFNLSAPDFSNGENEIDVSVVSTTEDITVEGTIDVRFENVQMSFDEGTTWVDASSVVNTSLSDLDVSDKTFKLVFQLASNFNPQITLFETKVIQVRGEKQGSGGGTSKINVTMTGVVPDVQFLGVAPPASEDGGTFVINVTLSDYPSIPVTVGLGNLGTGSASMGTDYPNPNTQIVISTLSQSGSFTVTGTPDSIFEGDETAEFNLTVSTGLTIGANSIATITLTDNDTAPTFQFLSASQATAENAGPALIAVSMTGQSQPEQTVSYTVAGISALNGGDFTLASGEFTVASLATTHTISVPFIDDAIYEGSGETFSITLNSVVGGGSIGATGVHTHTISDDEAAPVIQFKVAATTVNENTGPANAIISISSASSGAQTVSYVVANVSTSVGDYTLSSGSVTYSGASTGDQAFTIPINDDSSYEGNETFTVSISSISGSASLGANSVHTVTIADNEAVPTVLWTATSGSTGEDSGGVDLGSVSITGQAQAPQTVAITISGGTATSGVDYALTTSSVTFPSNTTTSIPVSVSLTPDSIYEGNETIIANLNLPVGGAGLGANSVHTHTIVDGDTAPVIQWVSSMVSPSEAAGPITLSVSISSAATSMQTVAYTVNLDQTDANDHNLVSGIANFAANSASPHLITVSLTDDFVFEGGEILTVTLSGPSAPSTLGAQSVLTVSIVDDETAPVVRFVSSVGATGEASGPATLAVSISHAAKADQTVTYTITDGTATGASVDFTGTVGALTFPGSTTANQTITIPLINDALYEGNETFSVLLDGAGPNATVFASFNTQTHTITDDETPPSIQWTLTSDTVTEQNIAKNLTLSLSAAAASAQTANFTISAGSAASGGDYTIAAGFAVIPAASTTVNVPVTIFDDVIYEGDEYIQLTLSSISGGATIGSNSALNLTISEDESLPLVSFTATMSSASEGISGSQFKPITFSISGASAQAVTVSYAVDASSTAKSTSPIDYVFANGAVTFPANSTAAITQNIEINGDSIYEADDTVVVNLSSPINANLGASSVHTYTIQNDDAVPTIQFQYANSAYGGESGLRNIGVQFSGLSEIPVTVPYTVRDITTTSGTDYTSLADGTFTIASMATSPVAPISFAISSDTIYEGDESFEITMSSATPGALGSTSIISVTISDDETQPTVNFPVASSSMSESQVGVHQVAISLSNAAQNAVTVSYTVISGTANEGAGQDFTLPAAAQVIFPAGSTAAQYIDVQAVNDAAIYEGPETFVLNLTSSTVASVGSNFSHTVTITDEEIQPNVQFVSGTGSSNENGGASLVLVSISGASQAPVTVDYRTIVGGTASFSGDYTLNPASGSTLIFPSTSTANLLITVSPVDNGIFEDNENFIVELYNPLQTTIGAISQHDHTIVDDENPPTIQFTGPWTVVSEENGSVDLNLTMTGSSQPAQTVAYTITGGTADNGGVQPDYSISASGFITILGGSSTSMLTIPLSGDGWYEGNETFTVSLSAVTGGSVISGTSVHTVTLTDDETQPTVRFTDVAPSALENSSSVNVLVNMSSVAQAPQTVSYVSTSGTATKGTDFDLPNATITIAPGTFGDTQVAVSINNDGYYELNETFGFTITGLTGSAQLGAQTVGTFTIQEVTSAPTVQFVSTSQQFKESDGNVNIVVSLSGNSNLSSTVHYTLGSGSPPASSGTDFTNLASGSVTFPAGTGSRTQTISVSIVDDIVIDSALEKFTLSLSGSPIDAQYGTTTSITVAIEDNDVDVKNKYGSSGQNYWNMYWARNPALRPVELASPSPCDGETAMGYGSCVHGGQIRIVNVLTRTACSSVTIHEFYGAAELTGNAQLFDWICIDTGPNVQFISSGLKPGKGLKDLIAETVANTTADWKSLHVVIRDSSTSQLVAASQPAKWWSDSFQLITPSFQTMNVANRIYWTPPSGSIATMGMAITAEGVSVVNLGTSHFTLGTATANFSPSQCNTGSGRLLPLCAYDKNYLWLETNMDLSATAAGTGRAMELTQVNMSKVHYSSFTGFKSTNYAALSLTSSMSNKVSNLKITGSYVGVVMNGSDFNSFDNLKISNNGLAGTAYPFVKVMLSDFNKFVDIQLANSISNTYGSGFLVSSSSGNTLYRYRISNIVGYCLRVDGSSTGNHFVLGTLSGCGGTSAGVIDVYTDEGTGDYNVFSHTDVLNSAYYGILLSGNSTNQIFNATAIHNTANVAIIGESSAFSGNSTFYRTGLTDVGGTYAVDGFPSFRPLAFKGYVLSDATKSCASTGSNLNNTCSDATFSPARTDASFHLNNYTGIFSATATYSLAMDWVFGLVGPTTGYEIWGSNKSPSWANARGRCGTAMTCAPYDFRPRSGPSNWLGKIADPTAGVPTFGGVNNGAATCVAELGGTVTFTDTSSNYLLNAVERMDIFDPDNDYDGLCEANESCLHTPNIGSYQGEGAYDSNSCTSGSGAASGARIYRFVTNGAP